MTPFTAAQAVSDAEAAEALAARLDDRLDRVRLAFAGGLSAADADRVRLSLLEVESTLAIARESLDELL